MSPLDFLDASHLQFVTLTLSAAEGEGAAVCQRRQNPEVLGGFIAAISLARVGTCASPVQAERSSAATARWGGFPICFPAAEGRPSPLHLGVCESRPLPALCRADTPVRCL